LTQRLERGAQLGTVKLRLFPGREVAALIDLVEVNEFVKSAPSPRFWCSIELARKDRDGHRERNLAGLLRAGRKRAAPLVLPVKRAEDVAVFVSQYSVMSSST
jgi:hypothetical protein